MKNEDYHKAHKIKKKICDLEDELEMWQKELREPYQLAYAPTERDYGRSMKTQININIFYAFRDAAINDLKVQKQKLEQKFLGL